MTHGRGCRMDSVDTHGSNASCNADAMAESGALTEAGAAEAYAKIWNRQDALQFNGLLSNLGVRVHFMQERERDLSLPDV